MPARGKPVVLCGIEYPSRVAACGALGLKVSVVKQRLQLGWSIEAAFGLASPPTPAHWKRVEVGGVEHVSLAAAARASGVPSGCFEKAARRGKELSAAKADYRQRADVVVGGLRYANLKEAAKRIGVRYATVQKRLHVLGWTVAEALGVEPPPSQGGGDGGIVYLVTHRDTGKKYVGLTRLGVEARWHWHVSKAAGPQRCSPRSLIAAIREYGPEVFSREQIAIATSASQLALLERELIRAHGSMAPAGFNLSPGGTGLHPKGAPIVVGGTKFRSIAEAARKHGLTPATVLGRIRRYGYDVTQAFSRPPRIAPVDYDGVTYNSYNALAQAFGVSSKQLESRRARGWPMSECLGIATRVGPRAVAFRGATYDTKADLARAFNLSPRLLSSRLAQGWSLERALSTGPDSSLRPSGGDSVRA